MEKRKTEYVGLQWHVLAAIQNLGEARRVMNQMWKELESAQVEHRDVNVLTLEDAIAVQKDIQHWLFVLGFLLRRSPPPWMTAGPAPLDDAGHRI